MARSPEALRRMVMIILLAPIVIMTMVDGAMYNFCESLSHGSFFEYGCCNGTVLDYGVDFQAKWAQCSGLLVSNRAPTIPETMWKQYACIVGTSLGKSALSLKKYARTMSEGFPGKIKKSVMELASSRDFEEGDDDDPIEFLNRVRVEYHKIEKEVCTGESSASDNWMTCDQGTDSYRENTHLRGDCCQKTQIPIRLSFLRRQPSEMSQECTTKLATEAGVIKKYSGFLEIGRTTTFLGRLPYDQSEVRMMCLQTCVFQSDFLAPVSYTLNPFNFAEFISNLITFLPIHIQSKILNRIDEAKLNEQVDDAVESVLDHLIAAEFEYNADKTQMRKVLRTCEAHNAVVRHVESVLMEECYYGEADG